MKKINLTQNELSIELPVKAVDSTTCYHRSPDWYRVVECVDDLIKARIAHCYNELCSHMTEELYQDSLHSIIYGEDFHFSVVTYKTMLEYLQSTKEEKVYTITSNTPSRSAICVQALKSYINEGIRFKDIPHLHDILIELSNNY